MKVTAICLVWLYFLFSKEGVIILNDNYKHMNYTGSCHCKKVTFEVKMTMEGIIACNCSFCSIKGLWLGFAPRDNFTLLSGGENLTTYKFNKHVIDHLFCKDCGVQAFSYGVGPDGSSVVAVNVRAVHGVDLETLQVTPYDGKNL